MAAASTPQLRVDLIRAPAFTGRMRRLWSTILFGALAWAGCAHKPDGYSSQGFSDLPSAKGSRPAISLTPPNLIVTPETSFAGRVVKVNASGRFTVLSFPLGHLPEVDARLNVYHSGLKVGEVRVSGPQMEDNIVGDLVNGTAQAGDEVREP